MVIIYGSLVKLVITPLCHSGGHRFKSGRSRHNPLDLSIRVDKVKSQLKLHRIKDLMIVFNVCRNNHTKGVQMVLQ